jgi:hypothetical protein
MRNDIKAELIVSEWMAGDPPEHGYYLAAWGGKDGESGAVSELWYNPANGWWTSRGYLQAYDGQRNWGNNPVPGVYAWMPMPPAPLRSIPVILTRKGTQP